MAGDTRSDDLVTSGLLLVRKVYLTVGIRPKLQDTRDLFRALLTEGGAQRLELARA